MRKRLLLISPYFPPELGGACRMMGGIAEHLVREGHAVDVLTLDATNYGAATSPAEGLRIFRVADRDVHQASTLASGQLLTRLLLKERYDLIICGVAFPSAVLAYAATRLRRIPFIVYSHGEDVTVVRNPGFKVAMKAALRQARHVFANSKFTHQALLTAGARAERTTVLYPSIDPTPFLEVTDADAQAFAAEKGLTATNNLLVTVARLQDRKGHDTVIGALPEIAERVTDVHYLILGKGDQLRLDTLADGLGVRDRVTILSGLSDHELACAYRLAKLNVLVSRVANDEVEGFGMVYLEAAATGRTSVGGNQGGAAEAVEHNKTGIVVDPTSVSETADAIIALLTDDSKRAEFAEAAKARMLAQFTDDSFLQTFGRQVAMHLK